MGDYTDLTLKVNLKADTPERVIQLIKSPLANFGVINDLDEFVSKERIKFPEHKFFSESRCFFLLGEKEESKYDGTYLSLTQLVSGEWLLDCKKSIKNHEGEIELFLDWISTYSITKEECGTYEKEDLTPQTISFDGTFQICCPVRDKDDGWESWFSSNN